MIKGPSWAMSCSTVYEVAKPQGPSSMLMRLVSPLPRTCLEGVLGVRIGGAYPKIQYSPVALPSHLPLLTTGLRRATVPTGVSLCQCSSFLPPNRSRNGGDHRSDDHFRDF